MIDYFKAFINYRNDTRFQELCEAGTFAIGITKSDPQTGEIFKQTYLYKNMRVTTAKNGFLLEGSLHKYRSELKSVVNMYNAKTKRRINDYKGFNGDLFTFESITETIAHLCGVLDISPHVCTLQNIEIGINNIVPFQVVRFIDGLLYHKGKSITEAKDEDGWTYKQFKHGEYIVKIYDKGKQYLLPNEVIRVEVKITKMRKLIEKAGINISTLADINETTLKQAFDFLCSEFNEVIYYDYSINTEGLTEANRTKLKDYQNRTFWERLTRIERHREKDRLNTLIEKHSDNYKGQIQRQMIAGYNATIEGKAGDYTLPATPQPTEANDSQKDTRQKSEFVTKSPPYDSQKDTRQKSEFVTKSPPYDSQKDTRQKSEFVTKSQFNYSVISLQDDKIKSKKKSDSKSPQKTDLKPLSKDYPRKCVITGISLELEKENARYIRTNTIMHVKETDEHLYSLLCSLLLPHTGVKPVFEKTIINQLAKQVRNRYYNKSEGTRSIMRGSDLKNQLSLDL